MDRLLPPRIAVSNSRKKVGEWPVAFLNRRLKYSSSSKPTSRAISLTGLRRVQQFPLGVVQDALADQLGERLAEVLLDHAGRASSGSVCSRPA